MSRDRPPLQKAATARELVESLLRRHGLEGKIEECRAWLAWDETVGPQIAAHARPVRVREGVLEVRVDQPVWMQQLQLLKPQILKKLNSRLDQPTLRDIYLRRGKVEREVVRAEDDVPRWRSVQLTPEEEDLIRETVAGLADPEVAQSLREVLVRQLRLEKARTKLKTTKDK